MVVLGLPEIQLIFFLLIAGAVLWFGFSMKIMSMVLSPEDGESGEGVSEQLCGILLPAAVES